MVVINLDQQDDAQMIVETLNARGTPLLPSDLVKNYLFHHAQRQGTAMEPLYDRYWRSFDDDTKYWRTELGTGHAKRARLDIFLHHHLTAITGTHVPVAHLFSAYRQYVDDTPALGAEDHLAMLHRYADVYRSFEGMPLDSPEGRFFERMEWMRFQTTYPFLLRLFAEYASEADEVLPVPMKAEIGLPGEGLYNLGPK